MIEYELEELRAKIDRPQNKELKAKAMNDLARKLRKLSQFDEAEIIAKEAQILANEAGSISEKTRALNILGIISTERGDYKIALAHYEQVLSLTKLLGDKRSYADIIGNISHIYRYMSDYPRSLENLLNALYIYEQLDDMMRTAITNSNIATVYLHLSDYKNCLKYYSCAITIYEELDNRLDLAIAFGNLGLVYQHLSDYPKALEYHHKALAIDEEYTNSSGILNHIGNIGLIYLDLSDFHKSIEYSQKSLEIAKVLEKKDSISTAFNNIGRAYFELLDYRKALDFFQNALIIEEEIGCKLGIALNTFNIGLVYSKKDTKDYNPKKAKENMLKAILTTEELAAKESLLVLYKDISAFFKQENDWDEYAIYIEKYHELYVEVQNEEVKKQADRFGWERKIAEMEKQKEIDLLKTEAEKVTMQQKIEFQAREVENTIHELIKKNDLLQQVQSGILKIKPHTKGEAIAHIEQLLDRVTRNITPLESISELDKQWTEVHKNFMDKLKGNFPDLTAMELKIAALLTMKLTSSNIASVLFLSKRTVESHRHSLRKKMGISVTDDIYNVLASYSAQ